MALENGENQDNPTELNTEPKKRSSKLILIAVGMIAIIIVLLLAFTFLNSNGGLFGDGQTETQDWFFRGAYANYEGSTSYLFVNMNISLRLEIVDFNSTHVKLLSNMNMQSDSFGTLLDEQETRWAPAENLGTFAWEDMEGYTSGEEYEDHVYIEGLGTKLCKIYNFVQIDEESSDMNVTVYVDPEIEWPLKLVFDIAVEGDQTILIDIILKATNIPELT